MGTRQVTGPHQHWCLSCRHPVTHDPTFPYGRCGQCRQRFGAERSPDPQLTEEDRAKVRRTGLVASVSLLVGLLVTLAMANPAPLLVTVALSVLGAGATVASLSKQGLGTLSWKLRCPCCNEAPGEVTIRQEVTDQWVETHWRDEVTHSTSHAVSRPHMEPNASKWVETETTTEHVRRVPYEVWKQQHVKDAACARCGYASTSSWTSTVR